MFVKTMTPLIMGGLLLMVACGGGSDESTAGQTDQPASSGSGQEIGREEFGMTEEQLVTRIEDTEAAIAACMDTAGFEYTPIDAVTFRAAMDSLASVPGLSDEEFVDQYGYGFTTLPPKQDFRAGAANQTIFDDLSDQDKTAYERTLWGDSVENNFVFMLENEDFEGAGGCTKTAIEETFSAEQLSPNFNNPFDVLVEQDSRYVDAVKKWSDCIAESGYDYESPEDAEDELIERYNDLTRGAPPETLTGTDLDALTELQGEERAIAAADLACAEEFLIPAEQQVERDISGRN